MKAKIQTFRTPYLPFVVVSVLFSGSQVGAVTPNSALVQNERAVVLVRNVANQGFAGPCTNGIRWTGRSLPNGRGVAAVESCGEQSPTLPIKFTCARGESTVTVGVPMVQALPRMLRGPFPVSLYGEGNDIRDANDEFVPAQIRQFRAMRKDGAGKGTLGFELNQTDPLFQALGGGDSGFVNIIGRTLGFHLDGSRKAQDIMRASCDLPPLNLL